jgi:hypothetical protein
MIQVPFTIAMLGFKMGYPILLEYNHQQTVFHQQNGELISFPQEAVSKGLWFIMVDMVEEKDIPAPIELR